MSRASISAYRVFAIAAVTMALGLCPAAQAGAATYPTGAGSFSGGLEGWKVLGEKCSLGLPGTCDAKGGYDAEDGDPAGSLAASSDVLVNAVGLFRAEVTAESPEFQAVQSGPGSIQLDRQFEPGGLLSVAPSVTYTVSLLDKTAGGEAKAIEETLTGESPFTAVTGTASLLAGHTYAIELTEQTSATLGVGLTGSSVIRFDNVSATGPGSNGGGTGGGGGESGSGVNGVSGSGSGGESGSDVNGTGGLTSSELSSLILSQGLLSPAILEGNRIFVKAKCPAKVGRACKVSVQGMLRKGKVATAVRTAKIAKGKARRLVLKVRPKAKTKVMKSKTLLFKDTVKAGPAKTTAYKRLKLIKR